MTVSARIVPAATFAIPPCSPPPIYFFSSPFLHLFFLSLSLLLSLPTLFLSILFLTSSPNHPIFASFSRLSSPDFLHCTTPGIPSIPPPLSQVSLSVNLSISILYLYPVTTTIAGHLPEQRVLSNHLQLCRHAPNRKIETQKIKNKIKSKQKNKVWPYIGC